MMEQEMIHALHDAFCNELKEIKAALDNNGGHFGTDREMCNAKACIHAIHDLKKIESMDAKAMPSMR